MTAPKARSVGQILTVREGTTVQRPDGSEHVVSGSAYVLDVPGTFIVDGSEVVVK